LKFLADECIEASIVNALRANGILVKHICEIELGLSDNSVLEKANNEGAILLTSDKDFGELVYRQGRVTHGVILLRLHGLKSETKVRIILKALSKHSEEMLGRFTVVTSSSVRISKPLERRN
jgi:predicted nuclease of predicted toxin-antitoxin system